MNEALEGAIDRIAEMTKQTQARFARQGLNIPASTAVDVVLKLPVEAITRALDEAEPAGAGNPPGPPAP